MPKLSNRALSVSRSTDWESYKASENEPLSCRNLQRIVLTPAFAQFLGNNYNDYLYFLLDTYQHDFHEYGIDLMRLTEEDGEAILKLYSYYLSSYENKE